jgi:hypothetical protein
MAARRSQGLRTGPTGVRLEGAAAGLDGFGEPARTLRGAGAALRLWGGELRHGTVDHDTTNYVTSVL